MQELNELSDQDRAALETHTLIHRFGGTTVKTSAQKNGKKKNEKSNKPKKEKSAPTHINTLERIKLKQSIGAIAVERSISIGTVFHHLEKLKGLQMLENADIDYLKDELAENDFAAILAELNLSDNGWLTPIYEKFEGKYSYENIRLVRLFV